MTSRARGLAFWVVIGLFFVPNGRASADCNACKGMIEDTAHSLDHCRKRKLVFHICVPAVDGDKVAGCYEINGHLFHYTGPSINQSYRNGDAVRFSSFDNKAHKIYFFSKGKPMLSVPFENADEKLNYIEVPATGETRPFRIRKDAYDYSEDGTRYDFQIDNKVWTPAVPGAKKASSAGAMQGPPVVDADG